MRLLVRIPPMAFFPANESSTVKQESRSACPESTLLTRKCTRDTVAPGNFLLSKPLDIVLLWTLFFAWSSGRSVRASLKAIAPLHPAAKDGRSRKRVDCGLQPAIRLSWFAFYVTSWTASYASFWPAFYGARCPGRRRGAVRGHCRLHLFLERTDLHSFSSPLEAAPRQALTHPTPARIPSSAA
jgi:hypothetical protein